MPSSTQKDWTLVSTPPSRKTFYEVLLADGTELIASWQSLSKKETPRWFQYVSEDPTAEKKPVPLDSVKAWRTASKHAVTLALLRELTVAERIQAAYDTYAKRDDSSEYASRIPVPPSRLLQPGDEIEYGALTGTKVVEVRDEGKTVIFEYRNKADDRHGEPVKNTISYMASFWLEVTPTKPNEETRLAKEVWNWGSCLNSDLSSIYYLVAHGRMTDTVEYQRDYIWSDEDKERFLDSLFEGREIGRFIFIRRQWPKADEILDGKQRLNTLLALWSSLLPYKGKYWHEMSRQDRGRVMHRQVQYMLVDEQRYSRAELLRLFLNVNAAGVPQTEAHLAKVRKLLAEAEAQKTGK